MGATAYPSGAHEYTPSCLINPSLDIMTHSNTTSFFRFANKRAIYSDGKIALAHARCTHLRQVIKSQNKIIYTVVNALNIYIH